MLEDNIDINTELVNLKSPINDSENEINTSFDNSDLKNIIKKEVEKILFLFKMLHNSFKY